MFLQEISFRLPNSSQQNFPPPDGSKRTIYIVANTCSVALTIIRDGLNSETLGPGEVNSYIGSIVDNSLGIRSDSVTETRPGTGTVRMVIANR